MASIVVDKVVFLEEMAVDPIGTLEAVLEFIGVSLFDDRGENVRAWLG